ncbi:MAG: aminotransferase class I/II-fold pyridoxal phosphate-dependent enzyme [Acidimicrobiaceae bacterium]|nr:aminotransferase class I/II-fold pyridoxal phosphate-dependent enzyme [Acidimicrobiaceae bacterium]
MMLEAGAHGGDGARIARRLGVPVESVLDLSQSLNPLAIDPRPILLKHLDAIGRYPDPAVPTQALASSMGVDPDRLLLTNGGAEAITLVDSLIGGSVREPEFALHPRGDGPLWRSNPQNPLGLLADDDDVAAVWDEAFYPLATGRWTRGDEGSIVVGSLTKLLACPGLRIGYVLADPAFIEACRTRQPAWSLNGLACEALTDLLEPVDLESLCRGVGELREELRDVLTRHGLDPRPSQANWILVDQPGLREVLMDQLIAVRDCANFGLEGVARIAVPGRDGIARLDRALDESRERLERFRHEVRSVKSIDG